MMRCHTIVIYVNNGVLIVQWIDFMGGIFAKSDVPWC